MLNAPRAGVRGATGGNGGTRTPLRYRPRVRNALTRKGGSIGRKEEDPGRRQAGEQ